MYQKAKTNRDGSNAQEKSTALSNLIIRMSTQVPKPKCIDSLTTHMVFSCYNEQNQNRVRSGWAQRNDLHQHRHQA